MQPFGGLPLSAGGHPAKNPASSADHEYGGGDLHALVKVLRPGSASRRARAVVREVLQNADLPGDDIDSAELIVAELAANAEKHARPPYELRIHHLDGVPTWCEIVDSDPDPHEIIIILNLLNSVTEIGLPLLAENGRGLLLAHRLSHGHCHVYATTIHTTATPGKAVAFALPTPTGTRLTFPPLPDLRPGLARLREWTDHHPTPTETG
ncbi:ATP-binding protein [Streptosporangium amethystogenes]|uniref:ATP-binding protein n=1 Tax=Streptosporangium amethystogenes TaxID=2002 RepID=UPI00068CE4BD|nr:ATP-binding protein [Streptosporangium amethystogenes]